MYLKTSDLMLKHQKLQHCMGCYAEVGLDPEWRSRLRQDCAFFIRTRNQKFRKNWTMIRRHFSISAVAGSVWSFLNTFVADWRVCASYVQMHRVRNDAYMRHSTVYTGCGLTCINPNAITFRVLLCLQRNFPQMLFVSRQANPKNFIQINQKFLRYEVW